ncbi:MAG: phosphatase [Eubacteriales bacterium]|nr:phosphatase [Eubacteriales bacterium]
MNIPYYFDLHTHSLASGHGTASTISDMAKTAAARGLSALGVSDHAPGTLGSATESYFRSLALAPRRRFGLQLLYGVELDILDVNGRLDLSDEILSSLDYAIASMHPANFTPRSKAENTEACIHAMKHPKVRILGHCDDSRYPVDYPAIVQAALEYQVFPEINNASLAPDGCRGEAEENIMKLLTYCAAAGCPVLLSSDSHGTEHLGDFSYAEALLARLHFPQELILNRSMDHLAFFKH